MKYPFDVNQAILWQGLVSMETWNTYLMWTKLFSGEVSIDGDMKYPFDVNQATLWLG